MNNSQDLMNSEMTHKSEFDFILKTEKSFF